MRTIRHWWPHQRSYTSYSISFYLHWFGFTIIVSWGTSRGIFTAVLREKVPPGRSSAPADLYAWELGDE